MLRSCSGGRWAGGHLQKRGERESRGVVTWEAGMNLAAHTVALGRGRLPDLHLTPRHRCPVHLGSPTITTAHPSLGSSCSLRALNRKEILNMTHPLPLKSLLDEHGAPCGSSHMGGSGCSSSRAIPLLGPSTDPLTHSLTHTDTHTHTHTLTLGKNTPTWEASPGPTCPAPLTHPVPCCPVWWKSSCSEAAAYSGGLQGWAWLSWVRRPSLEKAPPWRET